MENNFPESEWKTLSRLKPLALDRLCQRILWWSVLGEDRPRMDDSRFECSRLHSWMVSCFAGVVARVESLRVRMSEGERQVEGLFESLLAEAFS